MQLIFGRSFDPKPPNDIYERELVKNLPKKGEIALDWVKEDRKRKNPAKEAIVMIFPDLASVSYTRHIRTFALQFHNEGFKVGVYHPRGTNGPQGTLPMPPEFHSMPEDVAEVMKRVKQAHPTHKIYAVGLSYGCSWLGNYISGFKTYPETKYMGNYKGCDGVGPCVIDGALLFYPAIDILKIHVTAMTNDDQI